LLAWRIVGNFVGDAEWRSIDDAIERSLRANEPVLFGVQIKRAFIDSKRGMMSVEAYSRGRADFLEEIQTMASAVESYTDGGHAVLITGIYRNSEGKTLGYRIQNSWGDEVGQQGYFDADVSYMRTFFPRFFFKKGMFKPTS